jgi:hypothetical protein
MQLDLLAQFALETDAVVGEHGVDFVRNGFEKVGCRPAISPVMEFGLSKLRRAGR